MRADRFFEPLWRHRSSPTLGLPPSYPTTEQLVINKNNMHDMTNNATTVDAAAGNGVSGAGVVEGSDGDKEEGLSDGDGEGPAGDANMGAVEDEVMIARRM